MLFSKRVEAVNILVSLVQYMNGIKANSQGVYQQADYVQKREAPTAALFQNVARSSANLRFASVLPNAKIELPMEKI